MKTAAKIRVPQTTRTGSSSTRSQVQWTSSAVSDQTSTAAAWAGRPSRRSENRSAHSWASAGAGRTSMMSSVPVRIRSPRASMEPTKRFARPRASAEVP